MLPFCGYNMGDYFTHWLRMGANAPDPSLLPRIYYVNWFKKDASSGRYLWPGFGENIRVLKWITDRIEGNADGVTTPIGTLPTPEALDTDGLSLPPADLASLLEVDRTVWREEASLIPTHLRTFGDHTPPELWQEHASLASRLG
jgi:phosphoenolpyruvate carboxykinase (GTP)